MIVLIAAAVLPAAFLLYQVYKMDTIEKEPWSILKKLLLWGALSGIPAALVESLLTGVVRNVFTEGTILYNLVFGFVVAALVEESFKFLFLYKITFKSPDFNFRFDGVVYAVFVSWKTSCTCSRAVSAWPSQERCWPCRSMPPAGSTWASPTGSRRSRASIGPPPAALWPGPACPCPS